MLICNRALSVTNQVEYDQHVLASYKLLYKQKLLEEHSDGEDEGWREGSQDVLERGALKH